MQQHHAYVALNLNDNSQIKCEELPQLMKQIRKLIKIPHGNKIRTILLEEGSYRATGKDRKGRTDSYGEVIFHRFVIMVERWTSL